MADDPNNNPNPQQPNPAEAYQNLLKKHNDDANAVALKLFGENYELREKNRDLAGKVPGEGSLVLSADEAKTYNAFKQFLTESKLDLKGVKEAVAKVPTLEAEKTRLEKRDVLRDVAATGWDLEVLEEKLSAFPDATLAVKKEKDKQDATKEVNVPYITTDGKESSLEDFVKEKFPKYLPILKVEAAKTPEPAKPGNTADPPPSGGTEAADIAAKAAMLQGIRSSF